MNGSPEWFADEEFWATTYEFMFPDSRIAAAAEEVEQILALTSGSVPARVLDMGCGPGRHSIALANLGFDVTGVDRTAFLLDKAILRSAEEGIDVEWVSSDMREFMRPGAYELAISLFTSFGFFEDDAQNQSVLENLSTCLVPGGSLLMDVSGKEVLARNFEATSSRDVEGGVVVNRRRVVDDWSRMSSEWILIRDGDIRSFHFDHWIYSGREMAHMLREAGFRYVKLYGDLLGHPYDVNAKRLVAVGTK